MTAIRTLAFAALSALVLAACPAQVKDTDWDSETDTDSDTDVDTDTDTDTDSDTDSDTDTDTDPPDPVVWTLTANEWVPPPQTDEVDTVGYQTGATCPLFYNEEQGPEWSVPRCHSTGTSLTLTGPPADGAVYPVYIEYRVLVKDAVDGPAFDFDPAVDGDVVFISGWLERYENDYWGRWGTEVWADEVPAGTLSYNLAPELAGYVLIQPGEVVKTRNTIYPMSGDYYGVGDRWFALCVNTVEVVEHQSSAILEQTVDSLCEEPDSLRWIRNTDSVEEAENLRSAPRVSRRAPVRRTPNE